jgi:hypothetical protein
MHRILAISVFLLFSISTAVYAQGTNNNDLGGRIATFVYIPTGADIKGTGGFSFQPFFLFENDFSIYGSNLVFSTAGNGLYFPVGIVNFEGGDDGVLFGAGFNKFFESGAENGRWLGDFRVTHVTEVDCTSAFAGLNHVWYTGNTIAYLGGNINAAFGDSEGFGVGSVAGIKFSLAENFILELQGGLRSFEGESGGNFGVSLGITF